MYFQNVQMTGKFRTPDLELNYHKHHDGIRPTNISTIYDLNFYTLTLFQSTAHNSATRILL